MQIFEDVFTYLLPGDIPRFQRSKLDSIFTVVVADSDMAGKEQLMKQVALIFTWNMWNVLFL